MWQVQKDVTDQDLILLKKQGVNLIQSFSLFRWSDNEIKNFLDKIQRHSLPFVVSLCGFFKGEKGGPENLKNFYRCANFINKWKYHPAIKYWHTIDEPKNHHLSKEDQEQAYKFVKNLDPQRKILVSLNLTTQRDYNNYFTEKAFDILDIHAFVDPNISQRQRNLLDLIKKNKHDNYPIIITLRICNWSKWHDLPNNSLQDQYNFFIKKGGLTNNYGFYGWELDPLKGISQVGYLKNQFIELIK